MCAMCLYNCSFVSFAFVATFSLFLLPDLLLPEDDEDDDDLLFFAPPPLLELPLRDFDFDDA